MYFGVIGGEAKKTDGSLETDYGIGQKYSFNAFKNSTHEEHFMSHFHSSHTLFCLRDLRALGLCLGLLWGRGLSG